MTRDSKLLLLGLLAAILTGVTTLVPGDVTNPLSAAYYGIPLAALPYLRLASMLVGLTAAHLRSSWLPGKAEPEPVPYLSSPPLNAGSVSTARINELNTKDHS